MIINHPNSDKDRKDLQEDNPPKDSLSSPEELHSTIADDRILRELVKKAQETLTEKIRNEKNDAKKVLSSINAGEEYMDF